MVCGCVIAPVHGSFCLHGQFLELAVQIEPAHTQRHNHNGYHRQSFYSADQLFVLERLFGICLAGCHDVIANIGYAHRILLILLQFVLDRSTIIAHSSSILLFFHIFANDLDRDIGIQILCSHCPMSAIS